jgi:enterochelin esterase family protein
MISGAEMILGCLAMPLAQADTTAQLDRQLVPGVRTFADIRGGERQPYYLTLAAGQVAVGQFRGVGVGVTLRVEDPVGKPYGHFFAGSAFTPFDLVASQTGTYRLTIDGFGPPVGRGRFDLRVDLLSADAYADRLDRREFGADSILYQMVADIRRRGEAAVDTIVADRQGKGPVIEEYGQDSRQRSVTFLYRGDAQTEQVNTWAFMLGTAPLDMTAAGWMPMPLQRLAGSSLWYLRTILPSDALLGYSFEVVHAHPVKLADARTVTIRDAPQDVSDPLVAYAPFGYSVLRLPDAPPQPWIVRRPGVARGRLESGAIFSEILGERRTFTLYFPAGAHADVAAKRLLVVLDGEAYQSDRALVPTPAVLDNLIAGGHIPATMAVFVHDELTRDRDLVRYPPFAQFLARELVPWLRRNYSVSRRPEDTVIAGSSLGGMCSAYVAFTFPKIFGAALCQSPAMYPAPGPLGATTSFEKIRDGYALTREFRDLPRRPIRFYVDVGLFEGALLEADREFRDVLQLKGYPLTYVEHSGSHDYVYWRNSIGDGLIALLGGRPSVGVGHRGRRWRRGRGAARRSRRARHPSPRAIALQGSP